MAKCQASMEECNQGRTDLEWGGVLTGEFTDQNSTLASQCITYSTVKYLLVDV